MRDERLEKFGVIAVWLLSFVLHLLVINHFQGWLCTDTASYWLHAATFTGHDWSQVARSTTRYYSWGYSVLLIIPFLLASSNAIVMSKIMVIINAILCSLVFVLLYFLGKRIVPKTRKCVVMICAFLCSIYSTYFLQTSVALSESLLFFLYVLDLWMISQYLWTKRYKWAVLSGICCVYMYMVHHRTLGILFAFFCMLLVLYKKNRNVKEILCFFAPVVLGYVVNKLVNVWLMSRETTYGVYSVNTYGMMVDKLLALINLDGLVFMVQNMIGALWYILAGTLLMGGLGIVVFVKRISMVTFRYKFDKCIENRDIIYFFAVLSFIFSFAISMLFVTTTNQNLESRIDVLFYGRYFENVLSIFVFVGLVKMNELRESEWTKRMILLLLVVIMLFSVAVYYFALMINGNSVNFFSVTAILTLYSFPNFDFSVSAISILVILFGVLIILLFWINKKSYKMIAYGLIGGYFLYTGYTAVINVDNIYKANAYVASYPTQNEDAVYINNYISEKGIDAFGVYIESGDEGFSYQLMNPERHVIPIYALEETEELQGNATHIVIPKSLQENVKDGEVEAESTNYIIYRMKF